MASSRSCISGGAVYSVPPEAARLLVTAPVDMGTKTENVSDVSSSSFIHTTTNVSDERAEAESFRTLVEHLRLDLDFKLGANDLVAARRQSSLDTADFTDSVEHLAFYLRSPEAAGINHPKAWAIRQLRQGFYPAPAGFVSWDEKVLQAKVDDAEAKAARIKELQIRKFNADYSAWFAELSAARRAELLQGTPFDSMSPSSTVKAYLRETFARENGVAHLLDND